MVKTISSKHGIPIRLTDERWSHITEEHCELAGMRLEVLDAIADPLLYDTEADVLYINFKKPSHATDSELLDNDVIVRYENDEVIGVTILHASDRMPKS